ncbi:uncharacterized protein LOC136084395 [Hydra vulgaris]|uniref:Uncharacterized protein LOC136084395 n=1 Tax=Hydra vulgaris TaxID=6087 RepID=A0ABM4CFI4_HYDVU
MKLVILACLLSVLFAKKEQKNKKEILNSDLNWIMLRKNACFEASGNHSAYVPLVTRGWLTDIKLVHVSGVLKCYLTSGGSNFGCYDDGFFNLYITDNKNKIVFPFSNQQLTYDNKAYKLPGLSAKDNEMVLPNFNHPIPYLREEQYIEIWNGEDLFDYGENDNSGRVCVNIYGIIQ